MKSTPDQLRNRGYADAPDLEPFALSSCADLLCLLRSEAPQQRTIAARLLQRHPGDSVVRALCEALAAEQKLYAKIAVCETLTAFGARAAPEVARLLGRIGDNQHRSIPGEVFEKSSYPLPRDIAARTLGKMGVAALPALRQVLETGPLEAVREAIDAVGFACFHASAAQSPALLAQTLRAHGSDPLVRWKVATALQSFRSSEGQRLLRELAANDPEPRVREAASRLLDA